MNYFIYLLSIYTVHRYIICCVFTHTIVNKLSQNRNWGRGTVWTQTYIHTTKLYSLTAAPIGLLNLVNVVDITDIKEQYETMMIHLHLPSCFYLYCVWTIWRVFADHHHQCLFAAQIRLPKVGLCVGFEAENRTWFAHCVSARMVVVVVVYSATIARTTTLSRDFINELSRNYAVRTRCDDVIFWNMTKCGRDFLQSYMCIALYLPVLKSSVFAIASIQVQRKCTRKAGWIRTKLLLAGWTGRCKTIW